MIIAFLLMSIAAGIFFVAWRLEVRSHKTTLNEFSIQLDKAYYTIQDLAQIKTQLEEDLQATEQGRDEETECYEQQYLSFEEITAGMTKHINRLESANANLRIYRDIHLYTCLPDLRTLASVKTDMETAIEQMDDTPVFYSVLSYMG